MRAVRNGVKMRRECEAAGQAGEGLAHKAGGVASHRIIMSMLKIQGVYKQTVKQCYLCHYLHFFKPITDFSRLNSISMIRL